ncbi:hypothetical protein ACQ4LE_005298 [Meloidogyne hapla]
MSTNLNKNNYKNSSKNYQKNISYQNRLNGTLKVVGCLTTNKVSNERGKENKNLLFLSEGKSRRIRLDDVLWWLCFIFTAYYFDLPASVIFSRKINRFYLRVMILCIFMAMLFTFLFALLKPSIKQWIFLSFQLLTITFLLVASLSFCLATWDEFNIWSVYIAYVGTQSVIAAIAVL